jgi:ABC-2 type transport system permease protein
MSTTTAAAQTLDVSGTPRIPFSTLIRVELRKSYDTRAGKWLLGITAALATIAVVLVLIVVVVQDEPISLGDFVATTVYSSSFLLPVLGVLLVTSEWSQRTAMVTFTLEPHRGRVIASKLVAGLLLAGAVALIATLAALVANVLYAVLQGSPDWHFGFLPFLGFLAGQAIAMLTGFAFAALFLNTPAAICVYFAYALVLPGIFGLAANFIGWFDEIRPWIDFNAAQGPMLEGKLHGDDWAHLFVSGLIWFVLPLLLGLWRILRAEVK